MTVQRSCHGGSHRRDEFLMRRYSLLVLALLALAAPSLALAQDAQPAGSVTIEILDAATMAAIDAEQNGVKRGELIPDKQNKNLVGTISVAAGESGIVYVIQRDGKPVLILVREGQPAPQGAKKVAEYKDGDTMRLPAATLGIAVAGTTPSAATEDGNWFWGVSGGIGTGSIVGAIKRGCAEIIRELLADACDGTDRGAAWTIGGEVRRRFARRADIGVNVGFTKTSGFRKAFRGFFGSERYSGTGSADLSLVDVAVALGVTHDDRIRGYVRAGPSVFNATRVSTLTFRGLTDITEEDFSAVGARVAMGLDVRAIRNLWISAQGGRTWMRDGPWNEKFSVVMVVGKVMFGYPIR